MTKSQYIASINEVKRFGRIEAAYEEFSRLASGDFSATCMGEIESILIGIIERAVGDLGNKDYDSWTSYFIYDLNFGKNAKKYKVIDRYGKKWILSTPGRVYDFINLK